MLRSNKEFYKFVKIDDYKHLPPDKALNDDLTSFHGSIGMLPSTFGNEISFEHRIKIDE